MALIEEMEAQGNFLFKYRSYLPIVLLAVALVVFLLDKSDWSINYFYLALAVSLIGFLIRVHIVGHTPKNTSGRNTSEGQVADTLNTTGFYSIIRHPLYFGNFFMYIGFAVLTGQIWFVVACTAIFYLYYERIMIAEEQFLRRKFGAVYENWSSTTPPIIPAFTGWKKPAISFSLKKVLKKEKNGLLATFAIYYIALAFKSYVTSGSFDVDPQWMFYATAASAIIYLVLKLIKNNTSILEEEGR